MSGVIFVLTLLSALGSGLIAGVFFAFSTFVMAALARLPAAQGIAAMQSVNIVVINPAFFAAFFGTAALCVVLTVVALVRWGEPGAAYLVIGSVLYIVGSILVTMICNVPLNNALAAVDPASAEGTTLWTRYVRDWTMWNSVRTAASLAASACFALSLAL